MKTLLTIVVILLALAPVAMQADSYLLDWAGRSSATDGPSDS